MHKSEATHVNLSDIYILFKYGEDMGWKQVISVGTEDAMNKEKEYWIREGEDENDLDVGLLYDLYGYLN